jgi:prepilin signal peptidase PulO-like enzyme (type II secretory pathway)
MTRTIRILLLVEAATFVLASLIHSGWLVAGDQHHQARIAEGVIAAVLLVAVVVSWIHPAWTRRTGLVGQGFALLGTLVGVFTIAVGVGPRTVPDVVYHVGIIVVLALGLRVTARWRPAKPGSGGGEDERSTR